MHVEKDDQVVKQTKIILFFLWGIIILIASYMLLFHTASVRIISENLRDRILHLGFWGPLFFIVIYSLRSLVFFPASVLTMISGLAFGPLWGFVYTVVGENISANISFVVGHYFGAALLNRIASHGMILKRMKCRLRQKGMIAVLIMRLMFLPFDLVGYSSGVCSIRQRDFAMGTFIGTLPGLATFILIGSAFNRIDYLYGSLAIALAMAGIAIFLKRHEELRHAATG